MSGRPDRFEIHRPMLLAGFRRTYSFADAPVEIPADWGRFAAGLPLPGQVGDVTYGATCDADMAAGTFEYMASVEVEAFDGIDASLGRMSVPEAEYAVFIHQGPLTGIRNTIDRAYTWLATNGGWKDGGTPPFERYGPEFDPETGADIEMWLPVAKA